MRGIVRITLIVLAVSLGLAGCSIGERKTDTGIGNESGEGTVKNQTLNVLTNRVDLIENGTMDRYAAQFEREHPGTSVEFQGFSNYTADIMTRLSTLNMGDVLLLPANMLAEDLPQYFEPLSDDLFASVRFADYKSVNGVRYGIVSGTSTIGIAYNKKAMAKAGVTKLPTTLTSFYEACKKLKAAGITPIFLNYGAQWPMKTWGEELVSFMSGDPDYLNKMADTDKPWDIHNQWGQSMRIVQTLIHNGYTEQGLMNNQWELSKKKIADGEAAMLLNGNWVINQIIEAGAKPEDIGFFPFPYDDEAKRYAPLVPDWFIGVSKFSGNKELAKSWVKFFIEQSGYAKEQGYLPVKLDSSTDLSPQLKQFLSFKPSFVENVPPSDKFLRIAEKANLSLWSGEYIQDWIASPDLQKTFEQYNAKWQEARHVEQ
ncbi:ABC transporter substrate-binding protein [Paenibacillus sp. MMO-177]|uniref:ABC transporter substrate-binding protein n=1 Tax=Paenibacillus sp. MMO-177 TaxID=3081289 RepID=UPI003018A7FF